MRLHHITTLALGLAALAARPMPATAHDNDTLRFSVDVAEDFTQFVSTLVTPSDPYPKRGATFVTQGAIFPAGTIEGDGASFDPTSAGAIGRWTCRGIHLVSGPEVPAAPIWVHTAQLYELPDTGRTLTTDGLEGSIPVKRSVTGGTGALRDYVGEQRQEFLGFNATGGVNLRVTFVLRKAN